MEPLSSTSLLASDTQTADRVAANSNNLALAAAVGAAGIAASSTAAAAPGHDFAALHSALADGSSARASFVGTAGGESHGVSGIGALHGPAFDHGFQALASTSHTAILANNAGELTTAIGANHAPTALLQATEVAAHGVPAPAAGMEVAMPSVAALVAANGGVGAHTDHGQVHQIIADALLGGGYGPDINALLNALPGAGIGENAGLHGLATPAAPDVPAWDMGHASVFTMDIANFMTNAPMVLHHDAVQPVANG
jgi:hypothetical protein